MTKMDFSNVFAEWFWIAFKKKIVEYKTSLNRIVDKRFLDNFSVCKLLIRKESLTWRQSDKNS